MHNMLFLKGLGVSALVVTMDQLSKWWAFTLLSNAASSKIEVTSFFNLVMVWNKGISFGLFSQTGYGHVVFSIIAAAIIILLLGWLKKAHSALLMIAISLVIGGAIGNIIDRIRFQAVADFLDFYWQTWHWPAFNVADAAICVGVALLCIETMLSKESNEEKNGKVS